MKVTTAAVRSLLRYLFVTEVIDRDLTEAVPSVASWRMSGLPTGVNTDTVTALLASCDQTTGVGCRDFAVLMLMARLGLRAQEVAALRLEEVDWRAGELVIHGKGGRVDRLPLPADVGAALVGYLRQGRRPSIRREVFLRSCGPDAPMSRQSVVMVTRCASRRAGVPTVGAHQLRHRAASQVLAQGGSLAEVVQLLRHHGEETTAIYAKVDRAALAAVVRPWPQASTR
jgi:integrase/recombinase XerD